LSCTSCFRQIRVGLDLDEILVQIRICPDPLDITSVCNGLCHRTQQIVSMLGLFHMRCRNARNDNRHLLFLHSRIQNLRSPVRCPCNHQATWGQFRRSLEGHISSTFVGVEGTNKKARKNGARQCNSRRSDV
jgi:hypothetical protein